MRRKFLSKREKTGNRKVFNSCPTAFANTSRFYIDLKLYHEFSANKLQINSFAIKRSNCLALSYIVF